MERHYGWVIVAVGALMGCIGMGSMFSLAVFLDPITADTGWSRAGISGSMTVAFLAMGLGAFGWGWVSDRHGPRIVGIAGGLLHGWRLLRDSRGLGRTGAWAHRPTRRHDQWRRCPLPSGSPRPRPYCARCR